MRFFSGPNWPCVALLSSLRAGKKFWIGLGVCGPARGVFVDLASAFIDEADAAPLRGACSRRLRFGNFVEEQSRASTYKSIFGAEGAFGFMGCLVGAVSPVAGARTAALRRAMLHGFALNFAASDTARDAISSSRSRRASSESEVPVGTSELLAFLEPSSRASALPSSSSESVSESHPSRREKDHAESEVGLDGLDFTDDSDLESGDGDSKPGIAEKLMGVQDRVARRSAPSPTRSSRTPMSLA